MFDVFQAFHKLGHLCCHRTGMLRRSVGATDTEVDLQISQMEQDLQNSL